jgi:glucoamylase
MGSDAPGWPGIEPRWTSSAKCGAGAALGSSSRLWFTLSHGILNEIYYPRLDIACTRDMGLIITDGKGFASEEKRYTDSEVQRPGAGLPAYRLINRCRQGRYRVEKEIVTDPERDVLTQFTRFVPLNGRPTDYRVCVLLAPHLGNHGSHNTGWVGDYKGVPMLFAEREGLALALACSAGWTKRSAGFVGTSDGWQDIHLHGVMTWEYRRAEDGNIALMGEVDPGETGEFLVTLGFGVNWAEAGHLARASLLTRFDEMRSKYVAGWTEWLGRLPDPPLSQEQDLYLNSLAVLRTHEAKSFPGGLIASLSVPWGFAKGDDDLGGYHLVWPRDLVEAAGALLAAHATDDALRVIGYLEATQEADGHWGQNTWLDGTPYWSGVQLDETALPILLVDLARRVGALDDERWGGLWPMVRSAALFIWTNGPVSAQDRWEEDSGYSPFTLAAEIAALLAAADMADEQGEPKLGAYFRETADYWNDSIEGWTFACETPLAQSAGVKGYYVRIAPPEVADAPSPIHGFVPIKNRPPGDSVLPADQIISPDALALVRFGLRAPDDPRIVDTVKLIDRLLKVDTPFGPSWYRYTDDGYGEKEDGEPFDGTGKGRLWPLLTGERGHYELAAGRGPEARALLQAMAAFANVGGMLPEQVWDGPDLREKDLVFGRPTGSAMPLVWAHAEYIKLSRSIADGAVFDTPPQTRARYCSSKHVPCCSIWRFNQKTRTIKAGRRLRIETLAPAMVRWTADDWQHQADTQTQDSGVGLFIADLPTDRLTPDAQVTFTFFWENSQNWEGTDFSVVVK